MFNKLITFGVLASFILPAIYMARTGVNITPRTVFRIAIVYTIGYLALGIIINLLPNLVNPY